MTDWKWTKENSIVPSVLAIAVYANAGGGITIRQEGENLREDTIISFPVGYAEDIIKGIREAAEEALMEEEE